MLFEPGARLDDYVLLQPLGSGGMGEVWLARDNRLGRKVALEVLPSALTRDAGRVARFEQEARAASSLNHPNVCTILALGETPMGSSTSRWSTSSARRSGRDLGARQRGPLIRPRARTVRVLARVAEKPAT